MAEATNKLIVGNIRRNLQDKREAWLKDLPKVLWAQQTTKKRATNDSPFTLVYRIKTVCLMEASLPTITTLMAEDSEKNKRKLARNSDLLEEV